MAHISSDGIGLHRPESLNDGIDPQKMFIDNIIKLTDRILSLADTFGDIISNGVKDISTDLLISYNNNMSITISPGVAYSNGIRCVFNTSKTFSIDPVDTTTYIYIFAGWNLGDGSGKIIISTATTPTPPPGTSLYSIIIEPTTTEITASEVTDIRQQSILAL